MGFENHSSFFYPVYLFLGLSLILPPTQTISTFSYTHHFTVVFRIKPVSKAERDPSSSSSSSWENEQPSPSFIPQENTSPTLFHWDFSFDFSKKCVKSIAKKCKPGILWHCSQTGQSSWSHFPKSGHALRTLLRIFPDIFLCSYIFIHWISLAIKGRISFCFSPIFPCSKLSTQLNPNTITDTLVFSPKSLFMGWRRKEKEKPPPPQSRCV